MRFENSFEQNEKTFKTAFDRDDVFKFKRICNQHNPTLKIAVALINCLVSSDIVDRDIIKPLTVNPVSDDITVAEMQAICVHSTSIETDATKAMNSVASGDCAVLIGDNPAVIIIDTKGMKQRDVSAPETELSVAGPSEGFNENIMTNLSLVKKRIMTPNFKNEFIWSGKQSNSVYCICYIDGIVKPEVVNRLKTRLEKIDMDYLGDINYIAETIRDNKSSFIKTYGKTNRPDVLASKLLEGRIGIILNGSPTALTLPFLFIENFQTPDDYYINCWYANVGRTLRLIGFWLAVTVPATYLSVILHHKSILPPEWLYSISVSQTGVPLPSFLEMIVLFAVFEILRETGARMPSSIGLALNIVGAIILGQAAVEAKLVSAPMVIIVAFSGVTGLMVYDLKGVVFYLRGILIIFSAIAGIPALSLGLTLFLLLLFNMSSLGIPFMYVSSVLYSEGNNDTFFRAPVYKMNYRQRRFTDNIKRQGKV